jgi:hypothetical protein
VRSAALALAVAACMPGPSTATVYTTGATGGGWTSSSEKGPSGDSKLLTAGLITLGAGYLGSVVGSEISIHYLVNPPDRGYSQIVVDDMWVPILGPIKALGDNETKVYDACKVMHSNCDATHAFEAAIAVGAAAQITGVVLTVVGFMRMRHGGDKPGTTQLTIVPQSNGLAISGEF